MTPQKLGLRFEDRQEAVAVNDGRPVPRLMRPEPEDAVVFSDPKFRRAVFEGRLVIFGTLGSAAKALPRLRAAQEPPQCRPASGSRGRIFRLHGGAMLGPNLAHRLALPRLVVAVRPAGREIQHEIGVVGKRFIEQKPDEIGRQFGHSRATTLAFDVWARHVTYSWLELYRCPDSIA